MALMQPGRHFHADSIWRLAATYTHGAKAQHVRQRFNVVAMAYARKILIAHGPGGLGP